MLEAFDFNHHTCQFQNSHGDRTNPTHANQLSMYYGPDEEAWLLEQFKVMDGIQKSVSMGEDMVKEYVMYSLEVPLSKQFMSKTMAVFAERFHRQDTADHVLVSDYINEELVALSFQALLDARPGT